MRILVVAGNVRRLHTDDVKTLMKANQSINLRLRGRFQSPDRYDLISAQQFLLYRIAQQ